MTPFNLTEEGALTATALGEAQVRADVQAALKDAMVDRLPIERDSITSATKPADPPIAADEGAWNRCLDRFETRLQARDPLYVVYDHQRRFARDTLKLTFADSCNYLALRVLEYLTGTDR